MSIQYAGGTYVNSTFTGTSRGVIQSGFATQLGSAGWANLAIAVGQGKGNYGTPTISISSPGTCTFTGHGFLGNEGVIFQTSGALPTGLSTNVVYFVKTVLDANTFTLSSSAGGANINTSGSQSGTHNINTQDWYLQSGTTGQGLSIIAHIRDNLGTCCQISISSPDRTINGLNDTSDGANLAAVAARNYTIVAQQFQFFVFTAGTYTTSRSYAAGGVPYIPAPLSVPSNAGWLIGDCANDSDTTNRGTWRNALHIQSATVPNLQALNNGQFLQNSNNLQVTNNYISGINLVMTLNPSGNGAATSNGNPFLYRWANNDIITSDALLAWGANNFGDEPKITCQMWDALIVQDAFTGETQATFDTHNWIAITNSNNQPAGNSLDSRPRGTLFIRYA